jgi:hypothetical protein
MTEEGKPTGTYQESDEENSLRGGRHPTPSRGVTPAPSEKVRNAKLRAARYFALRGGAVA